MASATAAEVLADPISVIVDLVLARDSTLDHGVVAEITERIAGSRRAKRRRLAQALLDNPALLADGRSPAPRAVADLLIALRAAGARAVSPPVCAECGKQLRTIQRRGQDWYCGVCGPPPPEPCGACGQLRRVCCRDREGRPRCVRCPPDDGDPLDVIVDIVTGVDASLSAQVVAQAVQAAVSRVSQRRALAWALQERPDLLTGAGAETPVPAVLRLIDALCDAGAASIVHPTCPGCDRVIHLPPTNRRKVALPQLHREVPRSTLRSLRSRSRGGHPRRARKTVMSALPEHRSGKSRGLRPLRSPPPSQRPRPGGDRSARTVGRFRRERARSADGRRPVRSP